MKLSVLSLAAIAVGVAACADDPVQPIPPRLPAVNAAVSPAATRTVVEFNGPVRKDFAATVAALGGTVDFVSEHGGFAAVSGLTANSAAALGKKGGIGAVYPDVTVQFGPPGEIQAGGGEVTAMSTLNPAAAALFSIQWNMRAIHAPEAWALGNLGSPNVTAAILDSGLDYDNLDLNGLVDLSRSVSFVPSDDAIINTFFPTRNKIDDLGGHGTLVASQVSSNAVAFAGVSSRTKLMGVKIVGQNGTGSLIGILAGIIWAADHGADVANMSVGVTNGLDKAGIGAFLGLTNSVFNYANRAGMVIVVAAGNDARNQDGDGRVFSAYCEAPHVICVSATGPTSGQHFAGPWGGVDTFAPYSDFGHAITVSAPGGSDFGFVSGLCARHVLVAVGNSFALGCPPPGVFVLGGAGTSGAAPHVTGVVAQLIAKYGKGKPSQIKQLLLNSVDDLGAPGDDPFYGAGRVNLLKAMTQ